MIQIIFIVFILLLVYGLIFRYYYQRKSKQADIVLLNKLEKIVKVILITIAALAIGLFVITPFLGGGIVMSLAIPYLISLALFHLSVRERRKILETGGSKILNKILQILLVISVIFLVAYCVIIGLQLKDIFIHGI